MINHGFADLMDRVRKGDRVGALRVDDVEVPILIKDFEYTVGRPGEESTGSLDFETLKKFTEEKKMASNTNIAINKSKPGRSIKNVVFNDPATIVFWQDGSKTVVKSHNEVYDPEKGLAMAFAKKMFGNEGNYFNVFRKWLPEDYETPDKAALARPWKIWFKQFDEAGKLIGGGVYHTTYKRKNDATRIANKRYGDKSKYEFVVSMANPWKEE